MNGHPQPRIIWFKNDQPIPEIKDTKASMCPLAHKVKYSLIISRHNYKNIICVLPTLIPLTWSHLTNVLPFFMSLSVRYLHDSLCCEGGLRSLHYQEHLVHAAHQGWQGLCVPVHCGVQHATRPDQTGEVQHHHHQPLLWVDGSERKIKSSYLWQVSSVKGPSVLVRFCGSCETSVKSCAKLFVQHSNR